ncbi:hypothetical protein Y1Q_0007772 [Alligator mississippiensis]|uniref:Uncharacterized protein n=1 Tax=Alligator mississippiensis TaxID=8496 RepID=A0A151N6X5_ALLMI|nr:hypothetical protein Y1Q_0007772 [Alligator mississippiensis]
MHVHVHVHTFMWQPGSMESSSHSSLQAWLEGVGNSVSMCLALWGEATGGSLLSNSFWTDVCCTEPRPPGLDGS